MHATSRESLILLVAGLPAPGELCGVDRARSSDLLASLRCMALGSPPHAGSAVGIVPER
jgi:hypothetical protein